MLIKLMYCIMFMMYVFTPLVIKGETIKIVNEYSYRVGEQDNNCNYGNVIIVDPDTIIITRNDGIWSNVGENQSWVRLIECNPNIDYTNSKNILPKLNYTPVDISYINGDILIIDQYTSNLYKLVKNSFNTYKAHLCQKRSPKSDYTEYFESMRTYNDLLLFGLHIPIDDEDSYLFADQRRGKESFTKIKAIGKFPVSLKNKLDSVGVEDPTTIPIFNPRDNSIWVYIYGYRYIYVTDTLGELMDSILISAPNYRDPPIPKSRIHSIAVWKDWLSQWTSVASFNYVEPGYFIFQYYSDYEENSSSECSGRLYSTIVWDYNGNRVDLEVDRHLRIMGVHKDGRIIFAQSNKEEDKRTIKLFITRIIK